MQLRPSVKLILAAYGACGLAEGLIIAYWLVHNPHPNPVLLLMVLPFAAQIWAATRHAAKLATLLTVSDGRVKFETGMMSRSTRTIDLNKVQDVRIDQSPLQRLLDVGDLSLETAGETSRLVMTAIDKPHQIADELLSLARHEH